MTLQPSVNYRWPDRFTYLVVRSVRVSDSRWRHYCLAIGGFPSSDVGQVRAVFESEPTREHPDDPDELIVDPLELEEG